MSFRPKWRNLKIEAETPDGSGQLDKKHKNESFKIRRNLRSKFKDY